MAIFIGRTRTAKMRNKNGNVIERPVPRQVIRFLNDPQNRQLIRGVIAAGNRNFGDAFGRAGDVISQKCGVPYLYRFELMGTQQDVENVRKGVNEFWQRQPQNG